MTAVPALVFPTRLFAPTSIRARIVGQAIGGGVSLSGEQQFADVSGGGRVAVDFGDAALWSREQVLAWRRFVTLADGGATPVHLALFDRRHQPVNNPYTGADTFGTTTWVSDITTWTADEVTATVTSNAALGATTLDFNLTVPVALEGGEWFSILHPNNLWRLYRIARVQSGGTVGSAVATVATIRPPLREAVTSSQVMLFGIPRGVFQVVGDLSETVTQQRMGKATAKFVEWPGVPPSLSGD
jgi:hypothetical protein